jgi:hypothetical protein
MVSIVFKQVYFCLPDSIAMLAAEEKAIAGTKEFVVNLQIKYSFP